MSWSTTNSEYGSWYKNLNFNLKYDNCIICLEKFNKYSNIQKLSCDHIFHKNCIYKWYETNDKCPICRKEIIF